MANKTKLAVGLDLGATTTRAVICALEEDTLKFLGYGVAPVQAWHRSRLSDQEALAHSIRFALHEAELRAQVSPESVVIGVGGSVAGINSRGLYEFGRRREIEPDDLRYAVELGARVRLEDDRQVLQICPQDFTLDGRAGYRNPKGILCARLEANVHVVTASIQDHQALIAAVHQAHLAVDESIFEGIAAAYASVLPEDRARGLVAIDIGAQSTHVAVYDGDALLLATALPVGGDHLTRDVSWLLKVNYEDAESLKREYGHLNDSQVAETSLIEIPSAEGRGMREASRRQLNEISGSSRRRNLRSHIRRGAAGRYGEVAFGRRGFDRWRRAAARHVRLAERILNCQARNGLAIGIDKWPQELDTPVWTTAAGLAMYSGRLRLKREWKRASTGLAGLVLR